MCFFLSLKSQVLAELWEQTPSTERTDQTWELVVDCHWPTDKHPHSHWLSSLAGWGDNHRKVRRLVHWDISLLGKQKILPKAKQSKNLFTISYQQADVLSLPQKQGFITSNGFSGRLMPQPWMFPFLLLSLSFYEWAEHHTAWNILFLITGKAVISSLLVSCPACALSQWRVSACRVAFFLCPCIFEIGQITSQSLSLLRLKIEGKFPLQDIKNHHSESAFRDIDKKNNRSIKHHSSIFNICI